MSLIVGLTFDRARRQTLIAAWLADLKLTPCATAEKWQTSDIWRGEPRDYLLWLHLPSYSTEHSEVYASKCRQWVCLMLLREKSVEIQVRAAGVALHMVHFIIEVTSDLYTVSGYI